MSEQDLGWWVIAGDVLLDGLRCAANGESPDLVYAELYANTTCERPGDDPPPAIEATRKLAGAALRSYADRWHGTTEGFAQPTDYGTGVEYDEACQCGASTVEDGCCTERWQLLADASAIEDGRPVGPEVSDQ
jgi:hypothetical protein